MLPILLILIDPHRSSSILILIFSLPADVVGHPDAEAISETAGRLSKSRGWFFLMGGHASRVLDDRLLVTFIVKGSWEAILPKGRKLVYYHDCFTTFGAFLYLYIHWCSGD